MRSEAVLVGLQIKFNRRGKMVLEHTELPDSEINEVFRDPDDRADIMLIKREFKRRFPENLTEQLQQLLTTR